MEKEQFDKLKRLIETMDDAVQVYVNDKLCNVVNGDESYIAFVNMREDYPNRTDLPDSALFIQPESDCNVTFNMLDGLDLVASVDVDEKDGSVPSRITFAKVTRNWCLKVPEPPREITFRCPSCGHDKFVSVWEQELTRDESAKLLADGRVVIDTASDAKPGARRFVEYCCANGLCDAAWCDSVEMAQCGCFPGHNKNSISNHG